MHESRNSDRVVVRVDALYGNIRCQRRAFKKLQPSSQAEQRGDDLMHYYHNSLSPPSRHKKRLRLEESQPIRSVSRILWEDLTVIATEERIFKSKSFQEKEHIPSLKDCENKKYFMTSQKFHQLRWGKNPVKVFLFAKVVAGYFTVNSYGRISKVNDWRHVSGKDLRYRERAIFELACQDQLQIEVMT
ncbi:unnamed protein product [Clavelina lepadiformis]|uniref:Uncharacterized protein n=1 Tax=Clavelina lepadiformis TaxID=159417 RepID=A0ABP0F3W8_CLALP